MGRAFSIIFVVVGLGVALVAAVFALEAMYVIGRYDGCYFAANGNGSNSCHITGFMGLTAGGTAGDSGAVVVVVVSAILVAAGVILALGGAHRLGARSRATGPHPGARQGTGAPSAEPPPPTPDE